MKKILLALACLAFIYILHAQTLYSTTSVGGTNDGGTIFKLESGKLTAAFNFDTPDGSSPMYTNLVQASNGKFYGMTKEGGSDGRGAIFSYDAVSSTYVILKQLDFTLGCFPTGSLIQAADGKLYGMTYGGGSNDYGVIFSYDINSALYTQLIDFNGSNGAYPYGSLMQAKDGKLYGMTSDGGSNNAGVIFSYNPTANIFMKLEDLNNTIGSKPYGGLMQAKNGKLYGMTSYGGMNSCGVIFSYDPNTRAYTKLLDLSNLNGCDPHGSLTQATNGKLYGMTTYGGYNNYGTIFSFDIATVAYTKLKDMNYTTGVYPNGGFMQTKNGKLYGMTSYGGTNSCGVIFSFNTTHSKYTVVKNCSSPEGASPNGSLTEASNGKLYGLTNGGGNSNVGVLFSLDTANAAYNKLRDFGANNLGDSPQGGAIKDSMGILYGMTTNGGSYGCGVIYSYNPVTNVYTKLKVLDYSSGAHPKGSLVKGKDGKFYGMTSDGGSNKVGVLFSYNPATAIYTKLVDFSSNTGTKPLGSLIQAKDGKLYGMTSRGGYYDYGVIFCYDPDTNVYSTLYTFNIDDGLVPTGTLVQASDDKLYGTTSGGGMYQQGVLFCYDFKNAVYAVLHPFNGAFGGWNPSTLIQADNGKLYGMTANGGYLFYGLLFSYDIVTQYFSKLKDFDFTNGTNPQGSLMQASDGKLYGLTSEGGIYNDGVAFSFDLVDSSYTKLQDFDSASGKNPAYTFFTEIQKPIVVKISNASVQEGSSGQKSMTFNVTLSQTSSQTITVEYKTKDSTAIAPVDYTAQKGKLTFAPGVKKQTISILVNGDTQVEGNEQFKVLLGKPVNATVTDNTGVGNIVNDDNSFARASIAKTDNNSKPSVLISPNPATNFINIKLNGFAGRITVRLTDVQGKRLTEAKLQTGNAKMLQQQFDVSNIASGTYFIVVQDEQGNEQSIKFIKE